MDRRERQEILGQWGVRDPTPRELAEERKLADELEVAATAGRPLRLRFRLFRVEADTYVASLGGPLPYMVRLREIDRLTVDAERRLEHRWRELAAEAGGDAEVFAVRWRRVAERWNFVEANELIDRHNRWYPVEARLPFDPRKRDYVKVNGRPYTRRPLDAALGARALPGGAGAGERSRRVTAAPGRGKPRPYT